MTTASDLQTELSTLRAGHETTLSRVLLAAYEHAHLGGEDPAPHAAAIDRGTMEARRNALLAVEARCYVSKVQRQFLDRVLGT